MFLTRPLGSVPLKDTADADVPINPANRSPFNTASTIREHRVELGHMGREDEEMGVQVTNAVRAFVPAIEAHLAAGTLKPLEYELMDGVGYDAVVQAIKRQEKGGLAKKLVVRVKHE